MGTNKQHWGVAASLLAVAPLLARPTFACAGQSRERDLGSSWVTARVTTDRDTYRTGDEPHLRVEITNQSDNAFYVLKESWSGGVWYDLTHRRVVVAHYAFTWSRENDLRNGWTIRESYRPEFYEVPPGGTIVLRWELPGPHAPGEWTIEGKVSVLRSLLEVRGLEGTTAAEQMAKIDVLVPCIAKTIVIDEQPPARR